jgi:hypothetical protein
MRICTVTVGRKGGSDLRNNTGSSHGTYPRLLVYAQSLPNSRRPRNAEERLVCNANALQNELAIPLTTARHGLKVVSYWSLPAGAG